MLLRCFSGPGKRTHSGRNMWTIPPCKSIIIIKHNIKKGMFFFKSKEIHIRRLQKQIPTQSWTPSHNHHQNITVWQRRVILKCNCKIYFVTYKNTFLPCLWCYRQLQVLTWNFPAFVRYLTPLNGLYFSPYMSSRFTFSPVGKRPKKIYTVQNVTLY